MKPNVDKNQCAIYVCIKKHKLERYRKTMHSSKYSSDISLKKPSIVTTRTILVTEV